MTTWDDFATNLADDLQHLRTSDTLVLHHGRRILQLRQKSTFVHASVVSNEFLPVDQKLTDHMHSALSAAGWHAPEPPSAPNWVLDLHWPATTAETHGFADLLVHTLRDILDIETPDLLTYQAWHDESQQDITLRAVQGILPAPR